MIQYHIRRAQLLDLQPICKFVAHWLSTSGFKFSTSKHQKFITTLYTTLLFHQTELIGWAVVDRKNRLLHFLIAGSHRNQGHGSKLLEHLHHPPIRVHPTHTTAETLSFFTKKGYIKTQPATPSRYGNSDIYTQAKPQ